MRLKLSVLFLLVLLVLVLLGCSKKSTEPEDGAGSGAKWTVIGYMDGNNNLDISLNNTSYVIADVQEMEAVGSSDDVNMVVCVGSIKTGGIVKDYYIEHHTDELPDHISSPMLRNEGTRDMSDPQTVIDFLDYVKENYPAEHYLLIIDDHGGGWRGACSDDQNGSGNLMSIRQLKSAIEDFGGVDILIFHACLMGQLEVVYELKDVADYILGSEFTLPMESILGSQEWLDTLVSHSSITPEALSGVVVDAVYNAAVRKGKYTHFSSIDASQVQSLAVKVGNLGNHLVTESGSYWNEVTEAWGHTHYSDYDDPAFVDIREFINNLRNEPHLGVNPIIRADADSVIAALNRAVVRTVTNVPAMTRGGLTIHFPSAHEDFDSTNYVQLAFRSTNWFAFLSQFIANAGTPPVDEVDISGTVSWPGHGLSSNTVAFLDTSHSEYIVGILPSDVTPATGAYEISFTLTGSLEAFVEAWDDVNGNEDMDVGDGIGWYDQNRDGEWNDMLTFVGGTTIANADIELLEITPGKSYLFHKKLHEWMLIGQM